MEPVVAVRGLSKAYPGVRALDDVSFEVAPGSVHALLGENGAGKSTLIKLVAGAARPASGEIVLDGRAHAALTPRAARAAGIRLVAQERQACGDLSVAENVMLGRLPRRGRFGPVDMRAARREAARRLREVGVTLDPAMPIRELSAAQTQLVEIARALSANARLVIMDEPTAALGGADVAVLFDVIRDLRDRGVSFLYVSHHLEEVFQLADTVTVLRDGRHIVTRPAEGLTMEGLVTLLLGRSPTQLEVQRTRAGDGDVALEVHDVHRRPSLRGVTLRARAGEILAVTGGIGAGRRELARVIMGIDAPEAGEVILAGHGRVRSPRHAVRAGMAYLPEDRKRQGVLADLSVADNIALGRLATDRSALSWPGSRAREGSAMVRRLGVRTPSARQAARLLSGGNQQKAMLARWLSVDVRILVLDGPTEGIDIGSRLEIYDLLRALADRGKAIVLFTADFEEVCLVADRAIVLRAGRVAGQLAGDEISEERLYGLQYGGAIEQKAVSA
ncbi:MAG: ribose transport system ATP-binding protein [Solirubrobacteraceae bacterium]